MGLGIRTGIWRTESGSTIRLIVEGASVSGTYETAHGQPASNEIFDVTGFTDGEFIGFVVLWTGHHSITSWTGRYCVDDRGEHIRTLWHLGHKYKDAAHTEPTEAWNCIISNFSLFYFVDEEQR